MFSLEFKKRNAFKTKIKKLFKKSDGDNATVRTECTEPTFDTFHTVDGTAEIHITEEKDLINLWKCLKHGNFNYTRSIHFTISTTAATKKLGQMKQLGDVFDTLGRLPQLEEVLFIESAVFLDSVNNLFKKPILRKLQFHHCNFITSRRSQGNLWDGIEHQERLEVLEIIDCTITPFHKIRHNRFSLVPKEATATFSFELPHFLRSHAMLRRLVLDSCILDNSDQRAFFNLLSHNTSLEELEISPIFETIGLGRRHQYQARKRAIETFMTTTVPATLSSSNNIHLRKLIVSFDDYLLENIYKDAMMSLIDLVRSDNSVLTHAEVTHRPLSPSDSSEHYGDGSCFGRYPNSWLECNLQYYLRLNRQLRFRNEVATKFDGDSIREEVLPETLTEAIDLSCLRSLLQSSPDLQNVITKSAMLYQPKEHTSLLSSSTRSLPLASLS